MTLPFIHRATTLDLKVRSTLWRSRRRARRDRCAFASEQRKKPTIWNGRVLLGATRLHRKPPHGRLLRDGFCKLPGVARTGGFPDTGVFNGFGMGALHCSDGAFVLGEMAAHTAMRVGFTFRRERPTSMISGTVRSISPAALPVGSGGNRLDGGGLCAGAHWDCVASGAAIAMIRLLRVDMPGEALRARIEAISFGNNNPSFARSIWCASCAISRGNAAFCHGVSRSAVIGIIRAVQPPLDLKQVRALRRCVPMRLTLAGAINVIGATTNKNAGRTIFEGGVMSVRRAATCSVGCWL